jgi:hypothetical protein
VKKTKVLKQVGIESGNNKPQPTGGRDGSAAYREARKVPTRHASLTAGDPCSDASRRGKVYPRRDPGELGVDQAAGARETVALAEKDSLWPRSSFTRKWLERKMFRVGCTPKINSRHARSLLRDQPVWETNSRRLILHEVSSRLVGPSRNRLLWKS